MAKKKDSGPAAPEAGFEHSLKALQDAVRDLESGGLSLTDSLARYESGIGHLRQCLKLLKQAELRIQQLIRVDEGGKAVLAEFGHERSSESGKAGKSNRTGRPGKSPSAALWDPDADDDEDADGDDE